MKFDDEAAARLQAEGVPTELDGGPVQLASVGDAFTDARLAETVARDVLWERYLWAEGLGWLSWDGKRWAECPDKQVLDAIRTYALRRHAQAARSLAAGKVDKAIVDGWRGVLSHARLRALFQLAAGVQGIRASASDFDRHPDLLNVRNGVVDLRTGALTPHPRPELRLTRVADVDFVPGARHPDWTAALEALPADVRPWYQLRIGQAATGHTPPDDLLVVQVGGGENGKTTLHAGIRGALGPYQVNVSHRALLGDPSQHPTELMAFRGARLALVEETPEARRLSTVRLKQAVGTPQMRARYIRQDEIEWEATHALFLNSNYRPEVEETDHGTWRRLALVTFPYTFRKPGESVDDNAGDRRCDQGLRDRIRAGIDGQHEAVLAWIVDGAVAWYANGRVMPPLPERVARETRAWRGDSDLVLAYVDDRLMFDATAHVMSAELLEDFNRWLLEHGHRPWSDKTLASRFGNHDEVARHQVEKRRQRRSSAGLSRPPAVGSSLPAREVSERYWAWVGVRFRGAADDAAESWNSNPLSGNGTGGTARSGERVMDPYAYLPELPSHLSRTPAGEALTIATTGGGAPFGSDGLRDRGGDAYARSQNEISRAVRP